MPERGDQGEATASSRPAPGALSALLAELALAPPVERSAWDAALRPGAVFGRFELVQELGRGGFGIVWEARDRELRRAVAFKALRGAGRPEAATERFLREAEAAACLSHPNVVTLYDVGHVAEGAYLVLELLRGETLAARLERGPMESHEAVRVALGVARGIAHAHASGVVHRDLTPGNVFLCEDGQVKVLDLGMAHAFGHRTIHGGTPGYMAPEQVRGAPEDERTDVFALGVILYRMLDGRLPPAPGDEPPSLLDVSGIPSIGPLLARMLASDPVERPRDGGEVVVALGALEREMPSEDVPPSPSPRKERSGRPGRLAGGRRRRALALGAAVAVAAAVALAAILPRQRAAHDALGGPAAPSIAVLPFADMSPQKDHEYFSDGVAEEILNALSRVRGLRVTGRTSSFSFKGSSEDVRAIGRKLGVGTVLEGSVRRAGSRARITAKIVNVSDGFTVWSEAYDRELTDVFAVQEEIARAVVSALQVRLAAREAPSLASYRTARPEVYDAYLVARRLLQRGDPEGYAGAVRAYEKTIALEPGYAPAWADLAEALFWASEIFEREAQDEARRRALAVAERAVALDAGLATAWSVRGYLRSLLHWDVEGGRKDFERALALVPGDARVLRDYGCIILVPIGRMQEGIAAMVRASELDPLDTLVWTYLAMTYPAAGDYARGSRAAERALEVAPGNPYAAFWRAAILLIQGRAGESLASSQRNENEALRLTTAALAQHTLGDEARSRRALEALATKYTDTAPYQVAEIRAWRGEKDEAFAWLERALAQRDAGLALLTRDPFLRDLRKDPRYAALLRRMNLPAE